MSVLESISARQVAMPNGLVASVAPTGGVRKKRRSTDATGLATLDKIAAGGVAGGGQDGKPATEVTVKSIGLD